MILLDVDNKDCTVGMSCPPKDFVAPPFLQTLKLKLNDGGECGFRVCTVVSQTTEFLHVFFSNLAYCAGFFVLNLVCRDSNLRKEVLDFLTHIFRSVTSFKVPEEVNEIVFCTDDTSFSGKKGRRLEKSHSLIQAFEAANKYLQRSEDLLDISECLKQLKVQ